MIGLLILLLGRRRDRAAYRAHTDALAKLNAALKETDRA